MSTKSHKHYGRIRFYISSLISLGLSIMALWCLVPINDPHVKLNKLNLRNVNENYSTVYLEMELTNPNYYRGFNYSDSGWAELFYVSSDDNWELTWAYNKAEYHGFRKTLHWNFTMNISAYKLEWPKYSPLLKNKEAHIYVSLYLTYYYRILLWTTQSTYYQWLDTNVYLSESFDMKGVSYFNRTKDFTLAIST